jgi:hypothetical protein
VAPDINIFGGSALIVCDTLPVDGETLEVTFNAVLRGRQGATNDLTARVKLYS